MIPKIIHYIWLGGNPIPKQIQECIDSWKEVMPDFQIIRWDEGKIEELDSVFVKEAIAVKKWAFASDVIRLWALYKYGGIYLDTDVKVMKSFEPLLSEHAFIGREGCLQINNYSTSYHLTSYCIGAEKESVFIKYCLSYYEGRHFITSTNDSLPNFLKFDMRNASYIYSEIAILLGYNSSALAPVTQRLENNVLTILFPEAFAKGGKDAYCKHLSIGTWRDQKQEIESYTWHYKIKWRLLAVIERILRNYDYIILKLN